MIQRPRRLRQTKAIRQMARETRLSVSALVHPIFIYEGTGIMADLPSLSGQKKYSPDMLPFRIEALLEKGVQSVLLFGVPNEKDEVGSGAYGENGVVQQGVRAIKSRFPEMTVITDVCMCEYTSHGHCGILEGDRVHNDKTLPFLAKTALSHAQAGADIVAPSDMMDGRVGAIRALLDESGFEDISIMSYAAKYSSSFYGPFRDAAGSTPSFGDRKAYQMDYHNKKEALKETALDIAEGADFVIVKPALSYLDIVQSVSEKFNVPVAAYHVSGEYAMIKAAAKAGLIDEYGAICESGVSIFRAGADILITYFSDELAGAISAGDIG